MKAQIKSWEVTRFQQNLTTIVFTSISMISVLLLSEDSTINYVVVDHISTNFDPLLTSGGQLWTFYKPPKTCLIFVNVFIPWLNPYSPPRK